MFRSFRTASSCKRPGGGVLLLGALWWLAGG
eukprot:COSAG02_NODE_43406_length_375_cov_0.721014_1_plen_30_part_01